MIKHLSAILLILALAARLHAEEKHLVDSINPMIGASTNIDYGEGKTIPGCTTPFGLVQLSPDTITGGDNGSGYSWEHKTIEGFSFTHMSGIGANGDLGNFLVMPTVGPLKTNSGRENPKIPGYRSHYSHDTETAKVGYYAVTLADTNIRAELTSAPRAGIIRFTFPANDSSRIQIDLARRVGGTSARQYIKVVDNHTIEGWMKCTPAGGGWMSGRPKLNYTVYFSAQFSRPLDKFGVWSADIPKGMSLKLESVESRKFQEICAKAKVLPGCREMEGNHLGFYTEFPTTANQQVLLKCGISFVSIEGARKNLRHDIDHWDFDKVRRQNRDLWIKAFDNVAIEGADEVQKEVFATALYRTLIDPRSYSDVDGQYTGADNKIHTTNNFTYRTIFSGWDVFRSQFPLQSIINPELVNDEINSLLQQAELSGNGFLARWELMNCESFCMIGDPAVSVITQAYLAGIRNFDAGKAYAACRQSVLGPKCGRKDLADYARLGYVPNEISWTLENAYFDYCCGRFAQALGKKDDADLLLKRALNYKNIYDPAVGNMHAKKKDGSWLNWQGAAKQGGLHSQGCVESDPYQQGWFVPQDVQGLINLMGPDHFLSYLTTFFEKTPLTFKWNAYYNHANEPVHHVPYMFVYSGQPWLTQKWCRVIMDHAYGTGVKGLCGNEDVGQMSAWYILSAVGLHPVCPADNVYIIGSPLFTKATLKLDPKYFKGGTFTVIAHNPSKDTPYIQSAKLNGQPLDRAWLKHSEIVAGGTLELEMGPTPNKSWGSAPDQRPPSLTPVK